MTPEELVESACPIVGAIGAGYMFDPKTGEAGEKIGMPNMFVFYFGGRGGVLGDVDADVVTSAKGFFAPGLVRTMWDQAIEAAPANDCAVAYGEACASFGREKLEAVEGLDAFCELAQKVVDAADISGYAMFAGWKNAARADDAPAKAYQLVNLLREYRGSAHICATMAHGVTAAEAVAVTGGSERLKMFGWDPELKPDDGTAEALASAENATAKMVRNAYAALDADEADRFQATLESMAAAINS